MQVFYNGSKDSVDGYVTNREERPESQSKPKVDRN